MRITEDEWGWIRMNEDVWGLFEIDKYRLWEQNNITDDYRRWLQTNTDYYKQLNMTTN